MRVNFSFKCSALALAVVLLAVGFANVAQAQAKSAAARDFAQACAEAKRLNRAGRYASDYARLTARISSPPGDVPSVKRLACLRAGAVVGARHGDLKLAFPLYVQASDLPEADRTDWWNRVEAARQLENWQDQTLALTTLSRRWPETVQRYGLPNIRALVLGSNSLTVDEETRMALLEVLYTSKLQGDLGEEPSALWLELTRLLVEHGKAESAADVASHVTDAFDVLALRVDRRFDALVSANPGRFELNGAIERSIAEWRAIVARHPSKLGAVARLCQRVVDYGRYDQALALAKQTLDEIYPDKPSPPRYDDLDNYINWLHDTRARAYRGLGLWDSAVHELERAASLREDGHANVSNTLNLAMLQAYLGRIDEVLRLLGTELRSRIPANGYGSMQMHLALLGVAVQKNDARAMSDSLQFLREHQALEPSIQVLALVWTGNVDEAAAELMRRLKDPRLRIDALRDLQDFRESPRAPFEERMQELWLKVKARDDVRAAIEQVGRIEQIPLP